VGVTLRVLVLVVEEEAVLGGLELAQDSLLPQAQLIRLP
jgi:hypothetical protein